MQVLWYNKNKESTVKDCQLPKLVFEVTVLRVKKDGYFLLLLSIIITILQITILSIHGKYNSRNDKRLDTVQDLRYNKYNQIDNM